MSDRPVRIAVGERVTIYPRGKKKTWCADFWRDGRHCRQSLHTRNQKVAQQRALRLELDLVAGTYQSPPPAVSVRQAVDDYLTFLKTEHRDPKTLVKYKGILGNLVDFLAAQGVTRLARLTPTLFDRFRALRKADHHPKSMYTEGVVVKQFLKWAKSRKLVAENALADFKLVKPACEPRGGPDLKQVEALLKTLAPKLRTPVAVLAFTGLRAGELQRLRPDDLDLASNWVFVRSRPGAEPKTRLSRKVPLAARMRGPLEILSKRRRPWLFTAPASGRYPAGDGPLNVKRLNEAFLSAAAQLGLPAGRARGGYTLHSLRHFFETFTINAGIPQRAVDTWLGHRADRSMASVYYKLSDEESQKFMKRVPFGDGIPAADAGWED
jgi:integrase